MKMHRMHNNSNSTSTSTTLSLYVNRTLHQYADLLSLTLQVILTMPKCNQIARITGILHNEWYVAEVRLKKKKLLNIVNLHRMVSYKHSYFLNYTSLVTVMPTHTHTHTQFLSLNNYLAFHWS
jgi:hypothetical protein